MSSSYMTIDEAKELVAAAQELLGATQEEVRAGYEWDVSSFEAVREATDAARSRVAKALEAFHRSLPFKEGDRVIHCEGDEHGVITRVDSVLQEFEVTYDTTGEALWSDQWELRAE